MTEMQVKTRKGSLLSRRNLITGAAALVSWNGVVESASGAEPTSRPELVNDADIENSLPVLSNWGRWGPSDQIGTLNLITPAMRVEAAKLIKSGRVVSLGREFAPDTPQLRDFSYKMIRYQDPLPEEAGSIDVVTLMCHGFAITHVDALCHFFTPEGKAGMYNGYPIDDVTPQGARRLGIEQVGETGIVGRGVLLDVTEVRGQALQLGSTITPADLEAAEAHHQVVVGEGDILFVRNGADAANSHKLGTGLSASCLPWLKERGVAVLGGDSDNDVHPAPEGLQRWVEPIHMVGIPYMGLTLLDNASLSELSRACREEKRWTFMVSVAPWRLKGATGSAVNPLAFF